MKYYIAMKTNYCYMKQIWMNLTKTILNKQNQMQQDSCSMILFI